MKEFIITYKKDRVWDIVIRYMWYVLEFSIAGYILKVNNDMKGVYVIAGAVGIIAVYNIADVVYVWYRKYNKYINNKGITLQDIVSDGVKTIDTYIIKAGNKIIGIGNYREYKEQLLVFNTEDIKHMRIKRDTHTMSGLNVRIELKDGSSAIVKHRRYSKDNKKQEGDLLDSIIEKHR